MGLPCDWQISKQRVAQRGQHLLESGQWSDCKFLVGQEPQQQIVEGHKLFLAMASPVFEAMFYGSMAEKSDPIPILDVQPEAFKTLMEYIYTDHVDLESFELACELCYCAKKYMLPYLVEECTKYLWSDLSPKKACRAYEFAKLFEEPVLLEKCLHIMCTETNEILKENSWDEVEIGTIGTLFEQEDLGIDTEIDLFEALEKWARAECNRKSLAANDPKSLRSVTGNAIEKIRFLTLTPEQFANGPGKSQLLSRDEAFAILMNVSSRGSDILMPEGFSINCNKRRNLKLKPKPVSGFDMFQNHQFHFSTRNWMQNTPQDRPSLDYLWDRNSIPDDPVRSNPVSVIEPPRKYRENGIRPSEKTYCVRKVNQSTDCLNSSVLDCSVTFKVDKNICIVGVQVPTQIAPETRARQPPSYTEILYAHLLDSDGSRLTYTHFATIVTCNSLVEISFNRPVYIQKNKIYRIGVAFNKPGRYRIDDCDTEEACQGVNFTFVVGRSAESVRSGLIRSIVFTHH